MISKDWYLTIHLYKLCYFGLPKSIQDICNFKLFLCIILQYTTLLTQNIVIYWTYVSLRYGVGSIPTYFIQLTVAGSKINNPITLDYSWHTVNDKCMSHVDTVTVIQAYDSHTQKSCKLSCYRYRTVIVTN